MNIIKEIRENNPLFEIGSSGIIGTRKYQQDLGYYYTGSEQVLSVICDGMGGLEGGELASKTAVETIVRDFHNLDRFTDIPGFLVQEAERMDREVAALRNKDGDLLKAGTTFIAVFCRKNQMYWISVGDSRIYLVHGNKIRQVNREHNYRLMLKSKLDNGLIDQDTYNVESGKRQAEALISFIGMNHLSLVDTNQAPVELQENDIVLLCSDGISKSLTDAQVCAMVQDNDLDMDIAADRLTDMALRYGKRGQDNTTVVLMKYLGK